MHIPLAVRHGMADAAAMCQTPAPNTCRCDPGDGKARGAAVVEMLGGYCMRAGRVLDLASKSDEIHALAWI